MAGKKKTNKPTRPTRPKVQRVEKICQVCGKHFFVVPSKANKRFCSPKCYDRWLSSGVRHQQGKNGIKNCIYCGKPIDGFENARSEFDLLGFCSIECRRKHYAKTRTGRVETCDICGEPFYWSADENAIGYYCSEECAKEGHRRASAGFRMRPGRRPQDGE